jgi:2-polyprenyl-3-methyl-5-hydroxy-6-metoxy-1,4-benzoquinol methylase
MNDVMELIWNDEPIKALELVKTIDGQEARELQIKIEKKLNHYLNPEIYKIKYKDDPMGWKPEHLWNNRYQFVWDTLKNTNAKSYLDLGCYEGTLVIKSAKELGIKSVGVEACQNAVNWNISKGSEALFVCSFLEDYDDGCQYDVVSCMEVLEHVIDPQKLISVMKKHLTPTGYGIITTPKGCLDINNTKRIWNDDRPEIVFDHVRTYYKETLTKEIKSDFCLVQEVGSELFALFRK